MAYIISFKSSMNKPITIDKDVESFIIDDNRLMIRYADKTGEMLFDVFSIVPFYYHDIEPDPTDQSWRAD